MEKKNRYRYLVKNTILFTIGSFGTKFLNFFLVPLYTNVLSTEEYGTADLISTIASLMIFVFTINIADSVLRFAIDKKNEAEGILAYGFQILWKGSALFGATLIILYKTAIFNWAGYYYIFLLLTFATSATNGILSNYLRAIDRVQSVVVQGLIITAVKAGANILFLLFFKLGLVGYLLASILGDFTASTYALCAAKVHLGSLLHSSCSKKERKAMRSYSIPLIFNGVSWWINSGLDKFFVIYFCGVAANGIYAVSSKIPTILSLFSTVFLQAWNLSAIKEFDRDDKDGFFAKTYRIYNAGLILVCSLLILLNIPLARILFAKDFFEAWKYSSALLISGVFSAMSGIPGSIFTAVKDSRIFSVSTISAAIVNTILNILLIPSFGAQGAAIATAISFFTILQIRMICAKQYIQWDLKRGKEYVAYFLLALQIVVEHMPTHMYIIQVCILGIIGVLYAKEFFVLVKKLAVRFLPKKKG